MRLFLITFTFFWALTCLAGKPPVDTNITCIEKLQVPSYPPLAAQVRLDGVVVATVIVDKYGRVRDVSLSTEMASPSAKQLFTSAVDNALRLSKYSKGCGDKPITLVFNFGLGDELVPGGSPNVFFGYPNRFWISAPPNIVNPEAKRK